MTARDDVLARIRVALGPAPATVDVPRDYHAAGDHPPGDPTLVGLLTERLVDYRAHVRHTTPDELAAAIAQALTHGLERAPASGGEDRPRVVVPRGLPADWLTADWNVVVDDGLDTATLDACDAVVTAAAVAIAQTGTIVLDAGADQGRRAITLVPDLHICVVRVDQIVETVPEGIARLDPTRPLTWISGPSATSDIELDRVEGVHGPRTLEVVLTR